MLFVENRIVLIVSFQIRSGRCWDTASTYQVSGVIGNIIGK